MSRDTPQSAPPGPGTFDHYEDSIGCVAGSMVGAGFAVILRISGAIILAVGCIFVFLTLRHTSLGKLLAGMLAAGALALRWKSFLALRNG